MLTKASRIFNFSRRISFKFESSNDCGSVVFRGEITMYSIRIAGKYYGVFSTYVSAENILKNRWWRRVVKGESQHFEKGGKRNILVATVEHVLDHLPISKLPTV